MASTYDRQGWEPGTDDFERERNEGYQRYWGRGRAEERRYGAYGEAYRRGYARGPGEEFEGPDYYGPGFSGQRARQFGTAGIRGPYFGRGPKGYRRSDERIEEEINEILTRAGELDATNIEVKVQNGVATLTGSVESRRDKRAAEDLAEDVLGVRDVENRLRVFSESEAREPGGVRPQASPEAQGSREAETRGRSTVRV